MMLSICLCVCLSVRLSHFPLLQYEFVFSNALWSSSPDAYRQPPTVFLLPPREKNSSSEIYDCGGAFLVASINAPYLLPVQLPGHGGSAAVRPRQAVTSPSPTTFIRGCGLPRRLDRAVLGCPDHPARLDGVQTGCNYKPVAWRRVEKRRPASISINCRRRRRRSGRDRRRRRQSCRGACRNNIMSS